MATSLVVGRAGFTSSNPWERLLSAGCRAICFDNLMAGRRRNIEHPPSHRWFYFAEVDLVGDDPSASKERRLLDWEPRVGLEEGLKRTIECFREAMASDDMRVPQGV